MTKVIVKPDSPKNKIVSFEDDTYKIEIKAPAEKNKANIELIKFLSKKLDKDVKIISGFNSKKKIIKIENRNA
jgi:uncharacterized protein (TIGR00251 family)